MHEKKLQMSSVTDHPCEISNNVSNMQHCIKSNIIK